MSTQQVQINPEKQEEAGCKCGGCGCGKGDE